MYPEIIEYGKANRGLFFKGLSVDVRWVSANNQNNYIFWYNNGMFYNELDYVPFDYNVVNGIMFALH